MKIIKSFDKILILSACVIEKYWRDKNKCLINFYGGSGAFGADHSTVKVYCSYETLEDFLHSKDTVLEVKFETSFCEGE